MTLTIGKLAKQANVTIETIRYYQRKGLLVEPEKPVMGYRQYPSEAIARLRFIKRAQQSGFTLKEISELLLLDSEHCRDVQQMAEQKRQQIDKQLEDLTALRKVLDRLVKGCQQDQSSDHCSIIDTLSNRADDQF
jgi:MerR family mercuric resistance operon transcriptional regulator